MKRNFWDYIEDILKNMDLTQNFLESVEYDDFRQDTQLKYAIERALEIIGEALSEFPQKLESNIPRFLGVLWQECETE